MARRIVTFANFTPTAVADATNITDGTHISIQGASATQVTEILEIFLGGLATASAPTVMQLARHSQVGTGSLTLSTGASDEQLDPATAALAAPAVPFTAAATNKPQSDSAARLGSYAFNAFGGLVRNKWNPSEGPKMLGASASFGELGLNAFTGGTPGAMGGHIIYETA